MFIKLYDAVLDTEDYNKYTRDLRELVEASEELLDVLFLLVVNTSKKYQRAYSRLDNAVARIRAESLPDD